MIDCPIRKLAQQQETLKIYEGIREKELKLWELKKNGQEKELNKSLAILENLWAGLFRVLSYRKVIKETESSNNRALVWSNLLGSTYNPEELYKALIQKCLENPSKLQVYFTFWEGEIK